MKTKTFLSIILFFTFASNLFAQSYQWAKSYGGTGSENGHVATTNNGNVFVTGDFTSPTITFGSITLNKAGSSRNIYLAKYDPNGNVLWAKNVGGTSNVFANTITHGFWAWNDVFIAGKFSGTVTFGSTTLTSSGTSDMYLVQYDTNGNVLWAKSIGGSGGDDNITSIHYSGTGIALVGTFQSPTITFGSTTLTHIGASGDNNGFVAKYDSINCGINTFCWAKSIGGYVTMNDVASDGSGNSHICITGSFINAITFGTTTLTATGSEDIFIAKYDDNGNLAWAKREGGAYDERGSAIIIAPNTTDMYIAGTFGSAYSISTTTIIGSTTLATTGPNPSGWYFRDMFLAKLDGVGNVLWVKGIHGIGQEGAYDITSDNNKNVFVVGYFDGPSLSFGLETITNSGTSNSDIYIAKYDPNGNSLWAKCAIGSGDEYCNRIARYGKNYYILGSYNPSITFDNTTITSVGSTDIFLTKLYDCNTTQPVVCLVSVDTISWKNKIIWEKPTGVVYDSYNIYKEVSANIYDSIGNVPFNNQSYFIDYSSEPESHGDKYKIAAIDTCGYKSVKSNFHKTMNLVISTFGSTMGLSWTPYEDEGGLFVPGRYYIYRGTQPDNMQLHDSISGSFSSYNDNNVFNSYYYMVGVRKTVGCNVTKDNFSESFSNNKLNFGSGINDYQMPNLSIYPNPANDKLNIDIEEKATLEIINPQGQIVDTKSLTEKHNNLDLSNIVSGVYTLRIKTDRGIAIRKLIKQ